jgi:hypothetical protein
LWAQTIPFATKEYIDINNIRAAQLVHGDMWWNPATGNADCEYPKGSGKHIGFAASLWMAGYDNQGQLKVAAQTYRSDGNDYWPGPITSGAVSYSESERWAKIWKLNRSDLNAFLAQSSHTVANTPSAILTWPANGNTYAVGNNNMPLTITTQVAPFRDQNNNGVYEPLLGDYPEMKGDQMLWYVFNDNGPVHDQSNAMPVGVEVQCMTYAYSQNSIYDNMIFYDYKVINKSAVNLDSFVLGIKTDSDLGYAFDDYIGFDSLGSLGIIYNGDPIDGAGEPSSYGDSIPVVGIKVLLMPGDTCGNATPAGSFMYHNNSSDPRTGNPDNAVQFNNYLRGTWRDGSSLTYDYQGPGVPSNGTGSGPATRYAFSGNPSNSSEWSECSSMNPPGDRRFVIASQPFKLNAGNSITFATALIVTPMSKSNACPGVDFTAIRNMSDSAQKIFCNPPVYTSVKDIRTAYKTLTLYPNPAATIISLQVPSMPGGDVVLFDGLGRKADISVLRKGDLIEVNVSKLAKGMYYVIYRGGDKVFSNSFIKD